MAQDGYPLRRQAPALAAALWLAGCSLPGPYEAPPPAAVAVPPSPGALPAPAAPLPAPAESTVPAPVVHEHHLNAATRSLVTQARAAEDRGDLPAASTTLDRALKIEPTNPLVWIEIGRLRLAENDAQQAEHCGRKALMLASGDRLVQSQAGRVLADALRAQRRNQEARDVESQSYMN